MRVSQFIQEHLQRSEAQNRGSAHVLTGLLANWADGQDAETQSRLLEGLVLKYAEAERKLTELNQMKNKFLGIAAHDLRNPLSSIQGFSEILLGGDAGPVTEEQKEFLEIIRNASESMLHQVNDLLDLSAIESGRLELQCQPQSMAPLIEERVRMARIIGGKKGIRIQSALAALPEFSFDGNRIRQVVDNLIGNALKFSPSGTTVQVALGSEGAMAKVSVSDQGPGISPEDQAKMFREFQRLSAQPTGGEKSTGLGLAIAKKIIEAHRGSLQVESRVGAGSTFSFQIPLTEKAG